MATFLFGFAPPRVCVSRCYETMNKVTPDWAGDEENKDYWQSWGKRFGWMFEFVLAEANGAQLLFQQIANFV